MLRYAIPAVALVMLAGGGCAHHTAAELRYKCLQNAQASVPAANPEQRDARVQEMYAACLAAYGVPDAPEGRAPGASE